MISRRQNLPSFAATDQAHKVALQHFIWAREHGQSEGDIMRSIGMSAFTNVCPHRVIDALRRTWLALQYGPVIVIHKRSDAA